MLTSMHELLINTAALDVEFKLEELLHAVPFDLEGRLVKRVSLNGGSGPLTRCVYSHTYHLLQIFSRLGSIRGRRRRRGGLVTVLFTGSVSPFHGNRNSFIDHVWAQSTGTFMENC